MPKQTFSQIVLTFTVLISPLLTSRALGQTYEVPPSDPTISNPQSISDEEMKHCIELYNNLNSLASEIERDRSQVDTYSQASVDAFNSQIATHENMNADYNENCEGKSSESAERNTAELNNQ